MKLLKRQGDVQPGSACIGKSTFQTQMQAQAAIGRRRMNRKDREPLHAYRCGHCGQWHVGRALPRTLTKRPAPAEADF